MIDHEESLEIQGEEVVFWYQHDTIAHSDKLWIQHDIYRNRNDSPPAQTPNFIYSSHVWTHFVNQHWIVINSTSTWSSRCVHPTEQHLVSLSTTKHDTRKSSTGKMSMFWMSGWWRLSTPKMVPAARNVWYGVRPCGWSARLTVASVLPWRNDSEPGLQIIRIEQLTSPPRKKANIRIYYIYVQMELNGTMLVHNP